MISQPWIECKNGHGKEGVRGYVWCLHIDQALRSGREQEDVIRNVGLVEAPTATRYGVILCSPSKEHNWHNVKDWTLVCEKCLAERGWIKLEGNQAPQIILASELPKDLDLKKAGFKRFN